MNFHKTGRAVKLLCANHVGYSKVITTQVKQLAMQKARPFVQRVEIALQGYRVGTSAGVLMSSMDVLFMMNNAIYLAPATLTLFVAAST